jgi:chromate reductase, NAD(P)H dehydrogenase (quinone)
MRVLGVSGSLRRDSHNTSLLRAAAMSLPPGIDLELYDGLGELVAVLATRAGAAEVVAT